MSHWTEQAGQARVTVDREFFLSFTGTDRPWAEWLLAELDAAGYSSVSQLRDFVAGANFALGMDRAARRAKRTLGVAVPQALQAPYVQQEWAQRLADDPTGAQRALVLVRVEPCRPEALLRAVVYVDLVGLDEASARQRLREELAALIRGERRLPAEPTFPGGGPATVVPDVQRPRFPNALPPVWNVPFRRNPTFTGREQELAELAAQLGRGAATAVTQTLQGAGGWARPRWWSSTPTGIGRSSTPACATTQPPTPTPAGRQSTASTPGAGTDSGSSAKHEVTLDGIGPLRIGMTLIDAETAVGARISLHELPGSNCGTGNPMGAPEGLTLIFVDGRLARVHVQAPAQLATHAGIHLGSTEAEVRGVYPGRISTQQHPYDSTSHYLVLKPQAASSANRLLLFETDARVVTSYRAGERNAAQLIEGCA